MKKSVCIEMLGTHLDFYDRFKLVKESGFDTIEFWGWDNKDIDRIAALCSEYNLSVSSLSGDGPFSLCDGSEIDKYIEYAEKSMLIAKKLNCPVNVIHSNALGEGGVVLKHYSDVSKEVLFMNMLNALLKLAPIAEKHGIVMTLEALNTKRDHVGNALFRTCDTADIVSIVNSPYIKILYDVYHMQIMEGDIIPNIEKYISCIGHVHIADSPGRHEPGTGEINMPAVWRTLERCGYNGAVGFELSAESSYEAAVDAIKNL